MGHGVDVLDPVDLVEELFELSKLDAKQIQPNPEPFAISELAQDTLLKFRPNWAVVTNISADHLD